MARLGRKQNRRIRLVLVDVVVDRSFLLSWLSGAHVLTVQVAFTTPLLASPLLSFAVSAFSLNRDNSAFASHRERSQGGRAKLSVCPVFRYKRTFLTA